MRHQSKTAKPMTKVFFCGWIATAFLFRAPPSFSAYQNYFSIFYEMYLVETLKKESTFPQKIWGLGVCIFNYFAFMPSGLKNAIYNMLFLHVNCMSTGLPIIWRRENVFIHSRAIPPHRMGKCLIVLECLAMHCNVSFLGEWFESWVSSKSVLTHVLYLSCRLIL